MLCDSQLHRNSANSLRSSSYLSIPPGSDTLFPKSSNTLSISMRAALLPLPLPPTSFIDIHLASESVDSIASQYIRAPFVTKPSHRISNLALQPASESWQPPSESWQPPGAASAASHGHGVGGGDGDASGKGGDGGCRTGMIIVWLANAKSRQVIPSANLVAALPCSIISW